MHLAVHSFLTLDQLFACIVIMIQDATETKTKFRMLIYTLCTDIQVSIRRLGT